MSWVSLRNLETKLNREISIELFDKIRHLKNYLESIRNNNKDFQALYQQDSRKLLTTIIENFEKMSKLSKKQAHLLGYFRNLRITLQKISVHANSSQYMLWDWLDIRLDSSENACIYICPALEEEDIISKALFYCDQLENLFHKGYARQNCVSRAYRWMFNDRFGSIRYIRADLMLRFKCEEVNIPCNNATINW